MSPNFKDAVNRARLLPPRQKAVLKALARGAERKEIAVEMGLSVRTVENYCAIIYNRLNIHNGREAVRIALAAQI